MIDRQNDVVNIQSCNIEQVRRVSIDIINLKKQKYYKEYGNPHFVKLPLRIYDILKYTNIIYCEVIHPQKLEMLMGLIVCPTRSIETADQIEVF